MIDATLVCISDEENPALRHFYPGEGVGRARSQIWWECAEGKGRRERLRALEEMRRREGWGVLPQETRTLRSILSLERHSFGTFALYRGTTCAPSSSVATSPRKKDALHSLLPPPLPRSCRKRANYCLGFVFGMLFCVCSEAFWFCALKSKTRTDDEPECYLTVY